MRLFQYLISTYFWQMTERKVVTVDVVSDPN
jgi:hypothetical protein